MSVTETALLLDQTGRPVCSSAMTGPVWVKGGQSAIGILSSLLDFRITPARETIHLDRTQQRILRRALRRSAKIIA